MGVSEFGGLHFLNCSLPRVLLSQKGDSWGTHE